MEKKNKYAFKFLPLPVLLALLVFALIELSGDVIRILKVEVSTLGASVISSIPIILLVGMYTYFKPKKWLVFSILTAYSFVLLIVIFRSEIFLKYLRVNPILTLIVFPLPTLFESIIGGYIGQISSKKRNNTKA